MIKGNSGQSSKFRALRLFEFYACEFDRVNEMALLSVPLIGSVMKGQIAGFMKFEALCASNRSVVQAT
ncbi:MAG: hypothetical protein R6W74_00315 [Nitrosomonas halophila]